MEDVNIAARTPIATVVEEGDLVTTISWHPVSLIEKLAESGHTQWADWTEHMLDNMTAENIARWRRQIATPYVTLSEKEKEGDRKEARIVLECVVNHLLKE